MPIYDRPREKAWRYGIESLSDSELLAIIIGSGTKNYNAIEIAQQVINSCQGLTNYEKIDQKLLDNINGINKVKSLQLLSLSVLIQRINEKKMVSNEEEVNSDYLFKKYQPYLSNQRQEVVILVVLNKKKKVIFETTLSKGGNHEVNFSLKEMMKLIILHDGFYFYLIHNHPLGSLQPSPQDVLLTLRVDTQAKKLGFHMLDHLIITEEDYLSIREYIAQQ